MRFQRFGQAASLVLLLGFTALTATQTWQLLQSNPFSAALASPAQIERSIAKAMQRFATPDLVSERLAEAIAADDSESAALYHAIALSQGLALDPAILARYEAYLARLNAPLTRTADCLACAWDAQSCRSLSQMLFCKGPVLLTPIDDFAVLSQAGAEALRGGEIDRLDVALALVGLGATGLVAVSGGSSYGLKIGASAVKAAKRMGLLTAPMQRSLREAADLPIAWGKLEAVALRKAPLEEMVDLSRLAPLAEMASDLARIERATSPTEALQLLKYADSAADLKTTARVAESLGPDARGAFEVLGKSRVMRLALRLSDEVLGAITGVLLFFGQIGTLLGSLLARGIVRPLLKRLRLRLR